MTCRHLNVTIYSLISRAATREEPEEYYEWAECCDCGERLDIEDVPEEANTKDGEAPRSYKGTPHEFYD
jgi:hypothetical protein